VVLVDLSEPGTTRQKIINMFLLISYYTLKFDLNAYFCQNHFMSESVQLDLATMALKGRRYSEAESIYTSVAVANNSPEAWVGIGICKLYQLANGRTMDEVIFCFYKAKVIDSSLTSDINNQLIFNCQILLDAYFSAFLNIIENYQLQKKAAKAGALLAGISFIAGMNSKSAFGTIASLAGTSAGVGVAVDSFSKMKNLDEIKRFILLKCDEINIAVSANTDNSSIEYKNYVSFVDNLIQNINEKTVLDKLNKKNKKNNIIAGVLCILGVLILLTGSPYGLILLVISAIIYDRTHAIKDETLNIVK
jgi:hypothetical protein